MADPLWINASSGAPAYTAAELRQAMALALMYDGRNMGGRTGVRPGGTQLLVSLAGSTITVQPGVLCIDPGLTTPQGPYWVAIPAAETPGPLAAADATNPRKDIVIARVYDHDEDLSGLRLARTEYIAGVANPSPSEPAVPAGAIRLATIDVPKVGGGSPVVTDRRRYTAAAGGIVPVTVAGDISAGVKGRYRDRLDTGVLERDSGAAWEKVADPDLFKPWSSYTPTWTTDGAAPSIGNGTLTGLYKITAKSMDLLIHLAPGSTTNFGTGIYIFGLPPGVGMPDPYQTGAVQMVRNSPFTRSGGVIIIDGTGTRILGLSFTASVVAHNHPWTWANGDHYVLQGTFGIL